MAASKKKTSRKPKRMRRGHVHDTHSVSELRGDGVSVLTFTPTDKRLLGSMLGGMLGAGLGLAIADNPRGLARIVEGLPEAAKKMIAQDPKAFDGMLSALGIHSSGAADPVATAAAMQGMLFDVWSTTSPVREPAILWFERHETAIWRTTPDGVRHAFPIAFEGPEYSACRDVQDVSTSFLNMPTGICEACNKLLADNGYKGPRCAAVPPPPPPRAVDEPGQAPSTNGSPARPKRSRRTSTSA